MTRKFKYILTFIITLLFFVWASIPVYSSGGSFPLHTIESKVGTRALSAGGTFVSLANDNSAIFYNPGGLALMKSSKNYVGLQYLTAPEFLDENFIYTSYVTSFKKYGNIGVGLIYSSSSGLQQFDSSGDFVADFAVSEMVAAVAHSYQFTPWLSVGETLKFAHLDYEVASTPIVGLDIGALARVRNNISFGLNIKNIYSTPYSLSVDEETTPMSILVGPTITMLDGKGHISVEGEWITGFYNNEALFTPHFGFRYDIYKRWVSVKAGYDGENITFGMGTMYDRYQFDLGVAPKGDAGTQVSMSFHMSLTGLGSRRKFDPTLDPDEFGTDVEVNKELDLFYKGMDSYSLGLTEHSGGEMSDAREAFQEALDAFNGVLEINAGHRLAQEYKNRCLTWLKGAIPLQKEEKQLIEIHKKLARQYVEKKRYGDAIYEYRQVLKLAPDDLESEQEIERIKRIVRAKVEAFYKKGLEEYGRNKKLEALNNFNDGLSLDPEHKPSLEWVAKIRGEMSEQEKLERERIEKIHQAEVLYGRGLSYYGRNSLALAVTSFQECLKLNPSHERAKNYLALAQDELKAQKSGANDLKQAKARHAKGMVHMGQKDYAKAVIEFQAALAAYGKYQPSITQLRIARKKLKGQVRPLLREGKTAYRKRQMSLALEKFTLVRAIDPKNNEAPEYIARIKSEMGENLKYHMAQGRQKMGAGLYSAAIVHFQEVTKMPITDPQAKPLLQQCQQKVKSKTDKLHGEALAAYNKKDFKTAIKKWKATQKVDPAHFQAAKYLPLAIDADKASRDKKVINGWRLQAEAFAENREYAQAIVMYDKILSVKPKDANAKKEKARLKKELAAEKKRERVSELFLNGIKAYRKKNYDAAIKAWGGVLAIDKTNALAKKYIAKAKEDKKTRKIRDFIEGKKAFNAGKFASALIFFQKALRVNPNNSQAQDYLERTKERMAEEMEAAEQAAKAALRNADYEQATLQYTLAKKNALEQSDKARLSSLVEGCSKASGKYKQGLSSLEAGGEGIVTAIVLFSEVLEINPFDKKAASKYKEALNKGSEQVDSWLSEAESAYSDEKYKRAGDLYSAVLKINPGKEEAKTGFQKTRKELARLAGFEVQKGDAAFNETRFVAAIGHYNDALAIYTDDVIKDKLSKARSALEAQRAKRRSGGTKADPKSQALLKDGISLYRKGKFKQAIGVWNKIPKKSPLYPSAKKYIARAKLKL